MPTYTPGTIQQAVFANGGLADWYTVPAGTIIQGGVMHAQNVNAAAQDAQVEIQMSGGASTAFWRNTAMATNEQATILLPNLSPGDKIRTTTTTAAAMECTFSGIVRT